MDNNKLRTIISDIQAAPKENEWIEIKKDYFEPELLGEYISALANGAACVGQSKAYLVFGIDDATHGIIGTNFKPKNENIGNQEIENWIATLLNPRIDFVIHEITIDRKRVVIFIIDTAGNTPVKFRGTAYIRIGSYKKPLSEHPEKERKIWQNTHKNTFESRIAKRGVTADDVLSFIDYPSVFRLLNIPLPENKQMIISKLSEEKIIYKRASCYDITNLGAILFALDITKFSSLTRKAVRVIFYKDNNRINAIKEQVGNKGYAVGFENLVEYVSSNIQVNEVIGKVTRKEIPMYPQLAIREFIANALLCKPLHTTSYVKSYVM